MTFTTSLNLVKNAQGCWTGAGWGCKWTQSGGRAEADVIWEQQLKQTQLGGRAEADVIWEQQLKQTRLGGRAEADVIWEQQLKWMQIREQQLCTESCPADCSRRQMREGAVAE